MKRSKRLFRMGNLRWVNFYFRHQEGIWYYERRAKIIGDE